MHRLRRVVLWLVVAAAGLGAAGGAGAWWYHTTRPEYRLRRGQEAVRRGDWGRAFREAGRLEAAGCPDHARLLRGETHLRRGEYDRAVAELNALEDRESDVRVISRAV